MWYPYLSAALTLTQGKPAGVIKEAVHVDETARKSLVWQSKAVVVEVDFFGTQHVLGMLLLWALLTEHTQN